MTSSKKFQAKRAAVIYNPFAGRLSRSARSLHRTTELLSRQGIEAVLVPTSGPGSASDQARRHVEDGCDLVIAAGGDGTINEVANGLVNSRTPLAILPGGTANVLAREMRVPISIERAAAQISNLLPRRIAAGLLTREGCEQRAFLLMAGAGLDAEIVYHLDLDLKAVTGKLAYYVGGLFQAMRPLREFEVIADGKSYEASFALISRVRNYGGDLEIARGASLLLNEFEVVLFRGKLGIQYLPYLLGVALKCVDRMKGVTILRAQSVICNRPATGDVYVQVDGELTGKVPFSAEILPDALTLLVPPEYMVREQSYAAVPVCV
jgi:diacylglycerol kinase (ATP)